MNTAFEQYRYFLKDSVRRTINFAMTDQNRGIKPPPIQKPCPEDALRISLAAKEDLAGLFSIDLFSAIDNRQSHRNFKDAPLTLQELSFLLWATQGIRSKINEYATFRTVPSAGCRHALETYLCILNVEGLEAGIYRYLPVEHQLLIVSADNEVAKKIVEATLNQGFTGRAAVTFIWTTIPYRMEWRYDIAAHKVIAIDAGHVCQNLYLASSAIGGGVCAIAAYHQELMDKLVAVDGIDEFTIYLAAIGKI
ncbi:MAG TPA: SagB/ThcOx family dehydrogenase [Dissulfurispiraceae bacterium]|nr:SagB/ThcOx family dehydrogenase [Dissulfurispiraceae bacterium]